MASFTTTCPGIADCLRNEVGVKDPASLNDKKFIALWDTGATNCVITKNVALSLGLGPIGQTETLGVNGSAIVQVYIIEITLPNGIKILRQVTEGISSGTWDVLIGMDVITMGDFCVSNFNGVTTFSFRVPSEGKTDFVQIDLAKQSTTA